MAQPDTEPADRQLRNGGAGDRQATALLACRVIAQLASNPEESLSVIDLAERTGLKPEAVQAVLGSDIYRGLVEDACKTTCATLMVRGLNRVQGIIENGTDKLVLEALRTMSTVYRTVTMAAPTQDSNEAVAAATQAIEEMEAAGQIRISPQRTPQA